MRTAEEERRREDDRRRLELLERLERGGVADAAEAPGAPYHERYGIGPHRVRHYHAGRPSRYRRLRALSDLLLFAAYFALAASLAGAALTVWMRVEGRVEHTALLLALLVGWGLAGVVSYVTLKLFGELAFVLADLGDEQEDLVQLLLDLRDNTDGRRREAEEGPG